ncbi:MAG: ABC transporter ATP-binding protein [Leptolinea sp.]|nr:ABC transporter ATP-binding protein [Leptolinea sp.]
MTTSKTEQGNLSLHSLGKIFSQGANQVQAVDNVSLEIHGGEFITLLGPSGCGKTTTLRLIAGFELPTTGQIILDGKDIANDPPNHRPMAMVFQSYALFPHLNVFENVAFGLKLKKMPSNEINEAVEMVLHMMNLTGLGKRSPSQLSGGQQQRVALARAMVMKPKVLLFDEPLSNLDAKLRIQMRVEIRRLQKRLGITGIYVTHDQVEAMSLSDRIVVMNKGRIEQVGNPVEIFMRPSSLFVADFIGRANFIEVPVLERNDNTCQIKVFGSVYEVPCNNKIKAGSQAYLLIRPEMLSLKRDETSTARIRSTVYLGSSVEYELEYDGINLMAVDTHPHIETILEEGSNVSVNFDPAASYVLPYEDRREK